MLRFICVFWAAHFALLLGGCASSHNKPRRVTDENVSQLPWNRPERWESGGMMGGMMGQ